MRNSTVCYIGLIQHTVLLRTLRRVVPQTSVVPHSEHWTQWTSSVNPNLFWGCEIFPFTGRGTDGPKPEAGRAENGDGVLGRGQRSSEPTLHQLEGWGSVVSSPPFEIRCNLRPQNSVQKCLIMCKLLGYRKAKTVRAWSTPLQWTLAWTGRQWQLRNLRAWRLNQEQQRIDVGPGRGHFLAVR